MIRILFESERERGRFAIRQKSVSVDPTLLGVLDIVVDDEDVSRVNQLKIADVRTEVGLHDRDRRHNGLFQAIVQNASCV